MIRVEKGIVPLIILEKDDKQDEIKDDFAYVLGKNGLFIRKVNCLYTGIIKSDKIDFLGEVKPSVEMRFTKLPKRMFQQIIAYFKAIYKRDSTEVTVLLYFNFTEKKWIWAAPEQENSPASSSYKTDKMKFVDGDETMDRISPEFKLAGSIHSHASMSAFHSGTDDKDEINFDGLHITIGNLGGDVSYAVRWMVSGTEMKGSVAEAVEDSENEVPFPKEVMDMCKKKEYGSTAYQPSLSGGNQGHYGQRDFRSYGNYGTNFDDDFEPLTKENASKAVPATDFGLQFDMDMDSWRNQA